MIDIHNCRGWKLFRDNETTLKETSEDDKNNVYMTQSQHSAIDMDGVKTDYQKWKQLQSIPMDSVDALTNIHSKQYLIEFKNGEFTPTEVKNKLKDSLTVLAGCVDDDTDLEEGMEFILVFNPANRWLPNQYVRQYGVGCNSLGLQKTFYHICKRAGKEIILYGMETLVNITQMPIHTYPVTMLESLIDKGTIEW